MKSALVLKWYDQLSAGGDPARFTRKIRERYTEGTLRRLLSAPEDRLREAAVAALRVIGTMASNADLASCLHDERVEVRELAEAGLWAVWFRADSELNNLELQRLARLIADKEYGKALTGLNALIARAPNFAEAYNQRAILHWHWSEYKRSLADCEETMRRNPFHFGAQSGMGECHLRLKRPAEALKCFRLALLIHPHLHAVQDNVCALEQILKETRRTDERK